MFDLLLRDARLPDHAVTACDIGVLDGRIAAIGTDLGPARRTERAEGRLVLPGFVDSHLHLDKSCILDRCKADGALSDAIAEVARLKRDFTEADVYARAEQTLVKAILQGTTRIRSHVEIDPRIEEITYRARDDDARIDELLAIHARHDAHYGVVIRAVILHGSPPR